VSSRTRRSCMGLLMKVRDLGVTLISVAVIDPAGKGARDSFDEPMNR